MLSQEEFEFYWLDRKLLEAFLNLGPTQIERVLEHSNFPEPSLKFPWNSPPKGTKRPYYFRFYVIEWARTYLHTIYFYTQEGKHKTGEHFATSHKGGLPAPARGLFDSGPDGS